MWPVRPPKRMKNPSFTRELREMYRNRDTGSKKIIDLAQRIVNEFLVSHKSFASALTAFLDLCLTIDQIKVEVLGATGRTKVSNCLMQMVATHWVGRSHHTWDDWRLVEKLTEQLPMAGDFSWYYPKVHTVAGAIGNKIQTEEFARSIEIPSSTRQLFDRLQQEMGDVETGVREMMDELHAKRKYGLKPSYFQDGLFHRRDQAWVILGTHEFEKLDDPFELYANCIAQVILTEKSKIASLESRIRLTYGANYQKFEQDVGVEPTFVWLTDRLGELCIVPGGGMSVRDIFRQQDKELEYALVRFANTLRLYDLLVPLVVVESCPELPNQESSGLIGSLFGDGKNKRVQRLLDPRLIIPRLRKLRDNPEELVRLLEQEIEEDIERTRRKKRRHEVTAFARRLPKGHKASPTAQVLAAKEGIVLEEGETCVKRHERNKDQPPIERPHRAIPRGS